MVCFKVQSIIHNDGEKSVTPIDPETPEHGTRPDRADRRQQFEHEFNKLAMPGHGGVVPQRPPMIFSCRYS